MQLSELLKQIDGISDPPVESWNPEFCGDIDIEIKRNGDWYHEGGLISRIKMVKLFASIIKKENEDYFLVTPVEKVKIRVESTPFVAVSFEAVEDSIVFTNNLDQQLILDSTHPIILSNESPEIIWKRNIPARISTNLMYQLQMHAIENNGLKEDGLYLYSAGQGYLLEKISSKE
ncbi:DUF1285 domain-containing protein [Reinekea sp.]|jgi:hypothetical protein|uniref:DUF1285 domain-containing protein n=1 Tax=Reinekea sp. TaxID=1970455 RepID=UPI00398A4DCE